MTAIPTDLVEAIRAWAHQRPDLVELARSPTYPGHSKEVALMRAADRNGLLPEARP